MGIFLFDNLEMLCIISTYTTKIEDLKKMITREKIIEMIEALKEKQKNAKKVLKTEKLIENRAHTERYIKNINSICDRLAFNFNMLPDSKEFLDNTIAEAELFLQ